MKSCIAAAVVMVALLALSIGIWIGVPGAAGPAGLVGRWGFDDGTGKDLSGNGNDAVLAGMRISPLGEGRVCIELMPGADPMRIPASANSPLAIQRGTGDRPFWNTTMALFSLTTIGAVFRRVLRAKATSGIGI